ncbi:MAG: response regulator transcription factor [Pseudomonadales bacterium]|nr:response regulator transcription factor [Pseudomonadales bacterium]
MDVLLVDDHALFRDGLALLLSQHDSETQVHTCTTVAEALKYAEDHEDLDLALLDYNLPDGNGLALLKELKGILPATPIAMLSGEEDPTLIQNSLNAGASGFITKTSTSDVMLSAVSLIMNGGMYIPPAILAQQAPVAQPAVTSAGIEPTNITADNASPNMAPQSRQDYQLTERQKDVLREMVKGLSNKEIAKELNMSPSTVKVHVAAILRELEVKNRTQVVALAQQQGLCDD